VKFDMDTHHNHTYTQCLKCFCKSAIANMALVLNFEVISGKCNVDSTYIYAIDYSQK
jgi:hypothetical protein